MLSKLFSSHRLATFAALDLHVGALRAEMDLELQLTLKLNITITTCSILLAVGQVMLQVLELYFGQGAEICGDFGFQKVRAITTMMRLKNCL